MHGRVEPVRALLEAERREDALVEAGLLVRRVVHLEEGGVDARRLAHELGEDRPDRAEHLCHFGRLHEGLEVVEERRIGRVVPLEALDVAALQVEVALESGEELGEVVRRARFDPDLVAERGRADHLGPQFGGNTPLLLPVAARHADKAGLVGVVVERLFERLQALEQEAGLGVDEPLVRDPANRRHRLGTSGMATGWHRDLLVPCEHADGSPEVGDLGQSLLQRAQVRVHLF